MTDHNDPAEVAARNIVDDNPGELDVTHPGESAGVYQKHVDAVAHIITKAHKGLHEQLAALKAENERLKGLLRCIESHCVELYNIELDEVAENQWKAIAKLAKQRSQ